MDTENDYFLASFWCQSDYDKAVTSGPWESSFNPIFEEDPPVAPNPPPATSTATASLPASVTIKPIDIGTFGAPSGEVFPLVHKGSLPTIVMTRGKEPMPHVSKPAKHRSPPKQLSLVASRKAVTVQLPVVGPSSKPSSLTNRRSSTLSSARFAPFPRLSPKFNKSKHTTVVISENADTNVPGDDSSPMILPPSEPPVGTVGTPRGVAEK
ncbi:hypothetical protein V6N12_035189 [Hibiscus sabdariffa]|uniref:Uncharacterized protein n=1 Tax=Hibiscus sabdariffa TaxID=183260 RepID=A0ABR2ADN0_9ROSI